MFQRKPRRFSRRTNGRRPHNGDGQNRLRTNSFSNNQYGQTRNNFRPTQSAEKLLEKYNLLAKEALTSGDKTLSENYFQHADHFMRIIKDKVKNQSQVAEKSLTDNKILSENQNISLDKVEEKK